jgi:hypothetical protein
VGSQIAIQYHFTRDSRPLQREKFI